MRVKFSIPIKDGIENIRAVTSIATDEDTLVVFDKMEGMYIFKYTKHSPKVISHKNKIKTLCFDLTHCVESLKNAKCCVIQVPKIFVLHKEEGNLMLSRFKIVDHKTVTKKKCQISFHAVSFTILNETIFHNQFGQKLYKFIWYKFEN